LNSNYYHVIVQGIEKKYIFKSIKSKEKYKNMLIEKFAVNKVNLLAFCIMDNHAHMLIHTENIENLSKSMQSINVSFAIYYNKSQNRVGYVFRNRFKSIAIKNINHLYTSFAYIHLNPVNANICISPDLYEFSSYNDYMNFNGIANNETLKLLDLEYKNYKDIFKFMHYMHIEGDEFEKSKRKMSKEKTIEKYIKENDIKDIIFQSDKIVKMITDLKKEEISFSSIAQFFGISNRRLKEIIYE